MISDIGSINAIGLVITASGFCHVAGIYAMGCYFVGIHLDKSAKILVCHGAVIALQKIVHHGLPVGLEPVSQPVSKGKLAKIRCVGKNLFAKLSGLACKRFCNGIKIDKHQVAKNFNLDSAQANITFAEILDQFATPSPLQAPVKIVDPCMIRTCDFGDEAFAVKQFMASVLTNVVEGAQLTICTTYCKNAPALNVTGNVTAGFAKFFLVAEKLPGFVKNLLAFDAQKPRIDITVAMNRTGSSRIHVIAATNVINFVLCQV